MGRDHAVAIRRLTLSLSPRRRCSTLPLRREESAACGDLENIQSSFEGARDIELEEGAAEELQQTAADIEADLQSAQESADAELRDELDALRTAVQALSTRPRRPLPRAQRRIRAGTATAISDVRTSFQSRRMLRPTATSSSHRAGSRRFAEVEAT